MSRAFASAGFTLAVLLVGASLASTDENPPVSITTLDAHRDAVYKKLLEWYSDDSGYGVVNQRDHALQTALLAERSGAPDSVVVGALLHDIGWKLVEAAPGETAMELNEGAPAVSDAPPNANSIAAKMGILSLCGGGSSSDPNNISEEQQRAQHDVIGSTFIRMTGFDETVAGVIEGHVLAKRYLCFKDPTYHVRLSPGSARTLSFQGGVMEEDEAEVFEASPLFEHSVAMRRWDENAKDPTLKAIPDFSAYESRIKRAIVALETDRPVESGTYERDGNKLLGLWSSSSSSPEDEHERLLAELSSDFATKGYVVIKREQWLANFGNVSLSFKSSSSWEDVLAEIEAAVDEVPRLHGALHTYETSTLSNGTLVSRSERFVDSCNATLSELLREEDTSPLLAVVSHIAGEPVGLYKEKINYKAPGAGGYRAHQDYYTGLDVPQYSGPEDRGFLAYVAMIAVDDSDPENGCPEVGSEAWARKDGWILADRRNDTSPLGLAAMDAAMGPFTPVPLRRGDLLVYDNFMPHRSGANKSPRSRRALFGIFYGKHSTADRDLRKEYYEAPRQNHGADSGKATLANIFHTGEARPPPPIFSRGMMSAEL